MQITVCNVVLNGSCKRYSFAENGTNAKVNDIVVVENVYGQVLAKCVEVTQIDKDKFADIKNVLRVATEKDSMQAIKNGKREKEIKQKCESLVEKYKLEMRISTVSMSLCATKVLICFTSGSRVDFRNLVKDIANFARMRVELKQIGDRDEAKQIGGLGPCGNPCCCKRFLKDFTHSSIKMAKNQNLSLNPSKISGLCGRLMCCFAFENDHYVESAKMMPKVGTTVKTPNGNGVVVYNNLLKHIVSVKHKNSDETYSIEEYALDKIKF